ncbi:MAG: hypothetical protein AAGL17_01155 [Cyanobacteria bacterium J06576_12]
MSAIFRWFLFSAIAVILSLSDGIQGVENLSELFLPSHSENQANKASESVPSKPAAYLVIGLIVLVASADAIKAWLSKSVDQTKAAQISREYLHNILHDAVSNLSAALQLQGDCHVYIAMPYVESSLRWKYKLRFSDVGHEKFGDISIDVSKGELGYLIHNLKGLKDQKYNPQTLNFNRAYPPLGYQNISENNKRSLNAILDVKNSSVIGIFYKTLLCGVLVVSTEMPENLSRLEQNDFQQILIAFVEEYEELIVTIWQTTRGEHSVETR